MNQALTLEQDLEALKYQPAMEVSTEELLSIIKGRKEFFNQFYPQIVKVMASGTPKLMRAIAAYRDRNIEVLSSPYLLNYTIFGVGDEQVVWDITHIDPDVVAVEIKKLKDEIREGCKRQGFKAPASLFVNVTPLRVILLLIMRYYMERGQKDNLHEVCSYCAYSMFHTLFYNSFPYGVRKETMVYTMTNITNKHKLKNQKDVDSLLNYGITLCVQSYRQRLMDCTDHDMVYIIGQFKSRLRGYIVGIAQKYYENDKKKEAIFSSSEMLDTEEGSDFVERSSQAGDVEQLAQQYTTRFFQKPVDDEILKICAKMNQVSKPELKNAVSAIRTDKARIPEVKKFYSGIFYLYLENEGSSSIDVHSKKFLAAMDAIYKKGNSKEKNITMVKEMLDKWLNATSNTYREVTRAATINNFRKALYQYFIFSVTLRS